MYRRILIHIATYKYAYSEGDLCPLIIVTFTQRPAGIQGPSKCSPRKFKSILTSAR